MTVGQLSLADIRQALHTRGERMTRPRRAVLSTLAEQPGHLSAEQIVAAVADIDPMVHRASVYRTLDALTRLGIVQHVHLGHGATVYHLVSAGREHPHLHCLTCGSISDAPLGILDVPADRLFSDDGFVLNPGHIALSGLCRGCARRAAAT